jgi:hypothetical protein
VASIFTVRINARDGYRDYICHGIISEPREPGHPTVTASAVGGVTERQFTPGVTTDVQRSQRHVSRQSRGDFTGHRAATKSHYGHLSHQFRQEFVVHVTRRDKPTGDNHRGGAVNIITGQYGGSML